MRLLNPLLLFPFVFAVSLIACDHAGASHAQTNSTDLRTIIGEQIKFHVKPSYGELDSQCFTDKDLSTMIQERIPDLIAAQLKMDPGFRGAIDRLRAMSPDERKLYLLRSRQPLHKTWGELGRVTSEGQTDAGQKAELLIANSIVDLAESLLASQPPGSPKR